MITEFSPIMESTIAFSVSIFEKSNYDAFIVLTKSMHPKDFGVAQFRDNKLVNLVEKPENPPSIYYIISNIPVIL